jgi:hypothetical protein
LNPQCRKKAVLKERKHTSALAFLVKFLIFFSKHRVFMHNFGKNWQEPYG